MEDGFRPNALEESAHSGAVSQVAAEHVGRAGLLASGRIDSEDGGALLAEEADEVLPGEPADAGDETAHGRSVWHRRAGARSFFSAAGRQRRPADLVEPDGAPEAVVELLAGRPDEAHGEQAGLGAGRELKLFERPAGRAEHVAARERESPRVVGVHELEARAAVAGQPLRADEVGEAVARGGADGGEIGR